MSFNYYIKVKDNSLIELERKLAYAEMEKNIAYREYDRAIRDMVVIKSKIEKELTQNV